MPITEEIAGRTTSYKLLNQGSTKPFCQPSMVFDHLVRLAQPVMTAHRGDLFHDALYLHDHWSQVHPSNTAVLYFHVSPHHTYLGEADVEDPYADLKRYKVTLARREDGYWTLDITRLA